MVHGTAQVIYMARDTLLSKIPNASNIHKVHITRIDTLYFGARFCTTQFYVSCKRTRMFYMIL
jgi:hypothetical protein